MNKKYIGLLFALTLLLLKVFIIDADIPNWELAYYQPIDELFYVQKAYNYFSYGDPFYDSSPGILLQPIITNFSTYIGLSFFGDTYLGLRFGSLLLGAISLLFFWKLLTKITNSNLLINGFTILLALNFSFTLASIVVEPTIARTLMALFSIWIILKLTKKHQPNKKYSFLAGFAISFLFLITYPTNAFILPAAFFSYALVIYQKARLNPVIKHLAIYGLGYILAFLFVYLAHHIFGASVDDSITRGGNFSNRVSFAIPQLIQNSIGIANANFFRFNSLIAILLLISIFLFFNYFKKQIKKTTSIQIVISVFILFFVIQTIFINDYAQKKLIILLPLVLLFIAGQSESIKEYFTTKKLLVKSFLIISSTVFVILLQLNIYPKEFLSETSTIVSLIIGVIWTLIILLTFHTKSFKNSGVIITILLLALPELFMFNQHYIQNRTYHYKDTFLSLNTTTSSFWVVCP